jgi:hypothetical protein
VLIRRTIQVQRAARRPTLDQWRPLPIGITLVAAIGVLNPDAHEWLARPVEPFFPGMPMQTIPQSGG